MASAPVGLVPGLKKKFLVPMRCGVSPAGLVRFVPIGPDADVDAQRHGKLGGGFHD